MANFQWFSSSLISALAVCIVSMGYAESDLEFPDSDESVQSGLYPLLMPNVHPDSDETYLYTTRRIKDETIFLTGFTPKVMEHTAHHILLFGCEEPSSRDKVWTHDAKRTTFEQSGWTWGACLRGQTQYIWGWTKQHQSTPEFILPEGMGIRVGKDSKVKYLVLQVHYNKVDRIPPEGDISGILIHYTRDPLPKTAGVFHIMATGAAAPKTTTSFEAACKIQDERKIHPLLFQVHTHKLGKVASGWKVSPNNHWELIGERNPQLTQSFIPVVDESVTLTKGDTMAARCIMVNNDSTYIPTGIVDEGHEMCMYFILYWVEGKDIAEPQFCITYGPPFWSWARNTDLKNIPSY